VTAAKVDHPAIGVMSVVGCISDIAERAARNDPDIKEISARGVRLK